MRDRTSGRQEIDLKLNGHAVGIRTADNPAAGDSGQAQVDETEKAEAEADADADAQDDNAARTPESFDERTQTPDGLPLETRQTRPPPKSLLNTLIASGNFAQFVTALKSAGLTERLAGKSAFTIFAPTDRAFAKLDGGFMDALMKDKARLKAVLNYHFVAGSIHVRHVRAGSLMTLQGSTVTIATSPRHMRVNGAFLTEMDIVATNGVVHAIDAVILPAKLQLTAASL